MSGSVAAYPCDNCYGVGVILESNDPYDPWTCSECRGSGLNEEGRFLQEIETLGIPEDCIEFTAFWISEEWLKAA